MICHLQTFDSINYIVKEDKIGYKDQDGFSFNISYGYRTLFAYYHEHSLGNISPESLAKAKCMNLNCGNFSYAELPKLYTCIIGVSGTIDVLSRTEELILADSYDIKQKVIMPSAYGERKLDYQPVSDISIMPDEKDYFDHLHQQILTQVDRGTPNSRRAVLVQLYLIILQKKICTPSLMPLAVHLRKIP
jgi:hypothetical protein